MDFAATSRLKAINYISTFAAATTRDDSGTVLESFPQQSADAYMLETGYALSKWIAEWLLKQGNDQGIPVNIFRPSWILGHSKTGFCTVGQNHLLLLLKGCIQMGRAPNWETRLNIMPVDYISRIIVQASLTKGYGHVFNLNNHHEIAWRELILWFNKQLCNVQLIDPLTWQTDSLSTVDESNALYPLLPHYSSTTDSTETAQAIPSLPKNIQTTNAEAAMSPIKMAYPEIDDVLLRVYHKFLREDGFLGSAQDPDKRGDYIPRPLFFSSTTSPKRMPPKIDESVPDSENNFPPATSPISPV